MNNFYFYIFEFSAIFAILAILFKERKNKDFLETLILAVLYGVILEVLNVHMSGLYSYGKEFMVQIYNVPLAIGLGWAVIYYISHKSAKNYNLKCWQIPFDQEWFGVPYDNLFGWMAVIWTFSFFISLSRQNFLSKKLSKIIKYSSVIIAPFLLAFQIISYTILSAVVSGKFTLNEVMALYNKNDYSYAYYSEVQSAKAYILSSVVILLVLYLTKEIYKNRDRIFTGINFLPFLILILLHFFFLASIFAEGIYKQLPIIVFISMLIFTIHILLYLFPVYLLKNRNKNIGIDINSQN